MEYSYNKWSGVHALMVTPFKDDNTVDFDVFADYVRWQAANKPQFLFAVCGSAEMKMLSFGEREKIASLAVQNAGGIPVFTTGNLAFDWETQVEELKRLEQTGVAGFVFTTKGYGESHEKMYDYMTALAAKTTLPIVIYEFPGFKPCKMQAHTYGDLVKTGRFVGIKDTTCTMAGIKEKIAVQGNSSVLNANVPLLYDTYLAGGRGVMSTTTTCIAKLFVRQFAQVQAGDFAAAKKTHEYICVLDSVLGDGFPCAAKYFLTLQDVPMRCETREGKTLSDSQKRALDMAYDWAKSENLL